MNYAIIAAGEGSRLVQEGVRTPKPLIKINEVPLIGRLIYLFEKNGAESISIIVNEEMTEVREYIKNLQLNVPLNIIIKSTESSMHSFFELSKFLSGGKFCLTTVDTIFKEDEFAPYIQAFIEDNTCDGMMAVTDYIDDEKPLYVAVDEKKMTITDFLDTTSGKEKYISGGIYCLTPKSIATLNNCLSAGISRMRNFQRQLITDGLNLKAYPFKKIVDVDHVGDIEKAEAFLNE
ncbi:NTP transferase domain-containing protein [Bacteroidales bacterium OttesenSCG-928-M11]|nr:NTP transferase domain-containing protein [Bacteroidales bacterium OttesenSCG-928-M11]